MPLVGDPAAATVNVVPRDYVVDAIAYLSAQDSSVGRVFQLADPDPMTVRELLDELAKDTGHHIVCVPLPLAVAKAALRFVPGVAAFMVSLRPQMQAFRSQSRFRHRLRTAHGATIHFDLTCVALAEDSCVGSRLLCPSCSQVRQRQHAGCACTQWDHSEAVA